jgi:acyl-CoA thioester hydrolase
MMWVHHGAVASLCIDGERLGEKFTTMSVIAGIYSRFRRNMAVSAMNQPYIESIMTSAHPHFHRIGVLPADIDFMGHVNNARYLNWVQDAVLAHWNKLAPPETAAKYLWVALKHEITYRKPAFLNDEVIASVVLEKVQGARSFYDTVIKRGEEVLAEVKSSWCCIDAETLRPARIAADIQEYFFPKD